MKVALPLTFLALSGSTTFSEVDGELVGVVLGVCEHFSTIEGCDVVGDDIDRLVFEVGVIYAEAFVEPVDFALDELGGVQSQSEEHSRIL